MLDSNDITQLIGRDAYDSDGDKIGSISQVYADDQTGEPDWVTVKTGLFGTKETFIPLAEASVTDRGLSVPFQKAFVKGAPNVDEDGHLSEEQERELWAYYNREGYDTTSRDDVDRTGDNAGVGGLTDGGLTDRDTRTDRADSAGTVGHDTSGPTTDDAMTVSEERLNVGTQQREAGRARLKKYVVTENVTQTIPVQREEVRIEREPITDANIGDATSGPSISEEEHEVVLHEERAVVEKEAVPVERVRLDKETVTDQETVSDEVRKERVDVEGDVRGTDRNDRV